MTTFPLGGVGIDPHDQTVAVSITPAAPVFLDAAGTTPASFPMTISAITKFWMITQQDFTVSAKFNGVEVAGQNGTPVVVNVSSGSFETVSVSVDHPSEDTSTGGAGSTPYAPGAPVVRAFPFTHATPNLLTGAATGYTTVVDDLLLDAWFEITEAFDGTTPLGDFGTFAGHFGWFSNLLSPIDMTVADADISGSDGLLVGNSVSSLSLQSALNNTLAGAQVAFSGGSDPGTYPLQPTQTPKANGGERYGPGRFTAAHPIKIVVSQNGRNNGADPASTAGAGVLYLVTVSPA